MDTRYIRNFSIIAHIDHGKSTLADRMLELTGTITQRQAQEQMLDNMDIERERGITIKASAVTMEYQYDGHTYMLNLIDTPGHVDVHYEVSRALAACEGALLVVDASQGVEAQTVANAYLATETGVDIMGIINKVDLPAAQPDVVAEEMEHVLGIRKNECFQISAKTGQGVRELLDAICELLPQLSEHLAVDATELGAGDAPSETKMALLLQPVEELVDPLGIPTVVEGLDLEGQRLRIVAAQNRPVGVEGVDLETCAQCVVSLERDPER